MFLGVSRWIWLLFLVSIALFWLYPNLDLVISSLFFTPNNGELDPEIFGTFVQENIFFTAVFRHVKYVITATVIVLIIMLFLPAKRKIAIYLLLVLALAPGLIVNAVFKDRFGRARPAQIVYFGGDKNFTPPFVITDQCERNCSFSSGHAVAGFYFMAVSFVLKNNAAKIAFWLAFCYGWLIGIVRIAQGGHFASDVLFSFFVAYIVSRAVYYAMFERKLTQKQTETSAASP